MQQSHLTRNVGAVATRGRRDAEPKVFTFWFVPRMCCLQLSHNFCCCHGRFLLPYHLHLLAKKHFIQTFCKYFLLPWPILQIFFAAAKIFCKYVLLLSQPILRIYFVATTNFENICCCHYQFQESFLLPRPTLIICLLPRPILQIFFFATPNWEVLDARGRNYEAAVSLTQLSVSHQLFVGLTASFN